MKLQLAVFAVVIGASCALVLGENPPGKTGTNGAEIENSQLAVSLRTGERTMHIGYKLNGKSAIAAEVGFSSEKGGVIGTFESLEQKKDDAGNTRVTVRMAPVGGKLSSFSVQLKSGEPIVEIEPGEGTDHLAVSFHSSHCVVPDVFGDDLVFRTTDAASKSLVLPANCAFLELLDHGSAILLCNWPRAEKEVRHDAAGTADAAEFTGADVPCAKGEKIWVSVLAGNEIWREEPSAKFSPYEHKKIAWIPPFPARYRCDLQRKGEPVLTDSWRRATDKERVWYSFLNFCNPPLAITADGVYLRIPKFQASGGFARGEAKAISYTGPILIYPLESEHGDDDEIPKTPADKQTVLDVVEKTLGADWRKQLDIAEGVLDEEPYPEGFVFQATCDCTETAEQIFEKKHETDEADALRAKFAEMDQFVRYNRKRIEEYVAFAKKYGAFATEQRDAHTDAPELRKALGELQPLVEYIPDQFQEQLEEMKTPDDCAALAQKVLALIGSADKKRADRVKDLGKEIRTIGGTQDDLLGTYRLHVKLLRQKAGLIHAHSTDALTRDAMRGVLRLTQSMLRIRSPYEGH